MTYGEASVSMKVKFGILLFVLQTLINLLGHLQALLVAHGGGK